MVKSVQGGSLRSSARRQPSISLRMASSVLRDDAALRSPPLGEAGTRVDAELELTVPATCAALPTLRLVSETFLAAELARVQADDLLPDVLLALHEATANVVRHAYRGAPEPGPLTLRLEISPWLLRITVADAGPGYDFDTVPPPDFAHPRDGGYGLHLMRATMSRLSYVRRPGRNVLVLEKALRTPRRERAA